MNKGNEHLTNEDHNSLMQDEKIHVLIIATRYDHLNGEQDFQQIATLINRIALHEV